MHRKNGMKMQERKDYSINNQDKEEIISPVKELLEEQDNQHKTETDNVMKGRTRKKNPILYLLLHHPRLMKVT